VLRHDFDKVQWELCAPVGCGFKQVDKMYSARHFDKVPQELCAPVGCGFKQEEKRYSAITLIRCRRSSLSGKGVGGPN
jgi:hypothetical protein